MPEWKAAMILPLLYLHHDLTMWNRIANIVEESGMSQSAFSAARLVLKMYSVDYPSLKDSHA